jgi:hypothetical protein
MRIGLIWRDVSGSEALKSGKSKMISGMVCFLWLVPFEWLNVTIHNLR